MSADFSGWMRRTVEKALDGTKCMFFPGAQGDVSSTSVHPFGGDLNDTEISFDNEMKSPGMARFVGRALAGTVLQVYDKVAYMDAEIPYTAMELTTVVAEALRMCRLEHGPMEFKMELTGIQIGPVVLLGVPGELFSETGMELKKNDDWAMVLPCVLTNGSKGYFPPKSAYGEGGSMRLLPRNINPGWQKCLFPVERNCWRNCDRQKDKLAFIIENRGNHPVARRR